MTYLFLDEVDKEAARALVREVLAETSDLERSPLRNTTFLCQQGRDTATVVFKVERLVIEPVLPDDDKW